jgi:hypothetical protein
MDICEKDTAVVSTSGTDMSVASEKTYWMFPVGSYVNSLLVHNDDDDDVECTMTPKNVAKILRENHVSNDEFLDYALSQVNRKTRVAPAVRVHAALQMKNVCILFFQLSF